MTKDRIDQGPNCLNHFGTRDRSDHHLLVQKLQVTTLQSVQPTSEMFSRQGCKRDVAVHSNTETCDFKSEMNMSVCRLSVWLKFSMPFGTLATTFAYFPVTEQLHTRWHLDKILWRSSRGNILVGAAKHKRGIAGKLILLLITIIGSRMSFRLVPNSVTSDDLERRNSPNRRVIGWLLVRITLMHDWRYTNTFCSGNVGQKRI